MSWIDEARKRKAEETQSAAKAAKKLEAERTEQLDRFAADMKTLLPHGVEIVEAFFRDVLVGNVTRAIRVDLVNGVQFNLAFDYMRIPASDAPMVLILKAYEVGGPILSQIETRGTWSLGSLSPKYFSQTQVEDLLFEALEKHNAKRATR